MNSIVENNLEKIAKLSEKHKVKELYAFGSVLTDKFNDNSDVDLLVDFGKVKLYDYADNYLDYKEGLEKVFKRPVDLLENKAIRNPILRRSIDRTKISIYGRKSRKVVSRY
jgi:predicted nucleotidyltransferase